MPRGAAHPAEALENCFSLLADGIELWAVDALGIPDMLGADAVITSAAPVTDETVTARRPHPGRPSGTLRLRPLLTAREVPCQGAPVCRRYPTGTFAASGCGWPIRSSAATGSTRRSAPLWPSWAWTGPGKGERRVAKISAGREQVRACLWHATGRHARFVRTLELSFVDAVPEQPEVTQARWQAGGQEVLGPEADGGGRLEECAAGG